jgi:methyl-accepting chemotaxis protein
MIAKWKTAGMRTALGRARGVLHRWTRRSWFKSRARMVTDICERAAQGDLEARIPISDTSGEFGKMCQAINHVLDVADAYVRESAAAMQTCSRDRFHRPILVRGLAGSYRASAGAINAAVTVMQEHSENIAFVAEQASDTAGNVHAVAAACEELNATSTEISKQTSDVARETRIAAEQILQANASLQELQEAVGRIGKVVDLINNVAMQTNLLGLNATIEAAHAGEHGAGFAVVAAEVKKLSEETQHATHEIVAEVQHVQEKVGSVASTIGEITHQLSEFQHSAEAIALSVKEQLQATEAISKRITAVSQNAEEVSERIRQGRAQRAGDVSTVL